MAARSLTKRSGGAQLRFAKFMQGLVCTLNLDQPAVGGGRRAGAGNLEESELTPKEGVRQARRQHELEKLKKLAPAPQMDLFA